MQARWSKKEVFGRETQRTQVSTPYHVKAQGGEVRANSGIGRIDPTQLLARVALVVVIIGALVSCVGTVAMLCG